MSGKIHEKAILIITHYIGSTYAKKKAISFYASITFEQVLRHGRGRQRDHAPSCMRYPEQPVQDFP